MMFSNAIIANGARPFISVSDCGPECVKKTFKPLLLMATISVLIATDSN